jgi:hypothetical protein
MRRSHAIRTLINPTEVAMSDDPDHTRRWLINASGAAILSNALPVAAAHAQTAAPPPQGAAKDTSGGVAPERVAVSPITAKLADYVANALDRELPPAALAKTKLHVLDTLAAMVSGSRLKPASWRPATWRAWAASRRRW